MTTVTGRVTYQCATLAEYNALVAAATANVKAVIITKKPAQLQLIVDLTNA